MMSNNKRSSMIKLLSISLLLVSTITGKSVRGKNKRSSSERRQLDQVHVFPSDFRDAPSQGGQQQQQQKQQEVQPGVPLVQQAPSLPIHQYDYTDIERSTSLFKGYYARILLFDGEFFSWWDLRDKEIELYNSPRAGRAIRAIPLMVHALLEHFPDRFKKGSPPLQIMTEDGDSIDFGECTSHPHKCPDIATMPPLLAHGSVPVNTNDFPYIKPYPNWFFGECLYSYKIRKQDGPCDGWWGPNKPLIELQHRQPPVNFQDLIPTIVWRGSDHAFLTHVEEYRNANQHRGGGKPFPMLHNVTDTDKPVDEELVDRLLKVWNDMTPRWRGVILTVQEDLKKQQSGDTMKPNWIDVRYYEKGGLAPYHEKFNEYGVKVRADKGMDAMEQSQYKYQIDFGGGGGTTWRGTLTKLAMPGVLFHHETKMKDWYFDLLTPWQHYVPVDWDLNNLKERYDWAESHPEQCEEISKRATELVNYMLSTKYLDKLYDDLYRDYLAEVIDAYQPTQIEKSYASSGHMIQSHLQNIYDRDGYEFTHVMQCNDEECYEGGSKDGSPVISEMVPFR